MSLLKSIRAQLGLSVTPANNFTLDASADNGTMKLARGNAGATTQDVITVDADGGVRVRGSAATPTTGFVGETLAFTDVPTSVGTGTYNGIGYVTLTAGVWLLTGGVDYSVTTGPCQMRSAGFSTSNSLYSETYVLEQYSTTGGFTGGFAVPPMVVVVNSGTQVIYMAGRSSFIGGSITMRTLSGTKAMRIA